MADKKSVKKQKYEETEAATTELTKILKECSEEFPHLDPSYFKVLLKNEKFKPNRKQVTVRFIKPPFDLIAKNGEKAFLFINADWWHNSIDSDRTKAMVEALVGVSTDDNGDLAKRDFDVQTYSDLLADPKMDYSDFSKVLPAEKKPDELVLESQ